MLTTLRLSQFAILLFMGLSLFGCNTRYQAPVGDSGDTLVYQSDGRTHRVNAGETIYSIAWVYDLDYSSLAQLNGLSDPYQIFTGQFLNIDMRSAQNNSSVATADSAETFPVATTFPSSTPRPTSSKPISSPQVALPSVTGPTVTRPTVNIPIPPPVINNHVESRLLQWLWPTTGTVINKFSNVGPENKGIDIAGREGDSVLATEAGEIVYAGSGLLRYGDLVIIKHNEEFLSAYAHNSQLNVSEGERVLRGQKIAELGSTGITEDMLHFEIRLAGRPVDPLQYLPDQ